MAVINKSVAIKASPGKVFGFVTDPDNWTRFVTNLVDVRDLSPDAPAKGSTFRWTFNLLGLKLTGSGTVSEYSRNKSFGFAFKSKVKISEHYDFIDRGNGVTELKVRVEFGMPLELLNIVANSGLAVRLGRLEAKNILDKIRVMCEA